MPPTEWEEPAVHEYMEKNKGDRSAAVRDATIQGNMAALKEIFQSLPAHQRQTSLEAITNLLKESKVEAGPTDSNDSGWNPPRVQAMISAQMEWKVAQDAVQALGEVARGDHATIAALINLLEASNPKTRRNIADALGEVAPKGHKQAISALMHHMQQENDISVALASGRALGKLACGDRIVINALLDLVENSDKKLKRGEVNPLAVAFMLHVTDEHFDWVAEAVGQPMGKMAYGDQQNVMDLSRMLEINHWKLRRVAAIALGEQAPPGDSNVVGALMHRVETENDIAVINAAVRMLVKMVHGDQATISVLVDFLHEHDWKTRQNVAAALGSYAPQGDRLAIHDLMLRMEKDDEVHLAAIAGRALRFVAHGDQPTITALIGLLEKNNTKTRQVAAKTLGRTAPQGHEAAIRAMIKSIQNEDPLVAQAAVQSLTRVGRGDQQAIASLTSLLEHDDVDTRRHAADALGMIASKGDMTVIWALLPMIERHNSTLHNVTVVEAAGRALRHAADEDLAAISTLIRFFEKQDNKTRQVAADALGWIAQTANRAVILALMSVVSTEEDLLVVESAVQSLWKVAHGDQETITALLRLLEDSNAIARRNAAAALGGMALPGDPDMIAALLPRIQQEKNYSVANNALLALGRLARYDYDTIEVLMQMLEQKDEMARRNAAVGLGLVANYGNEAVIDALMFRIEREDDAKSAQAAGRAVAELAYGDQAVISSLLHLLEAESWEARRNAANALGGAAAFGDQSVIRALMLRVEKEESSSVVETLGQVLWRLDRADKVVRNQLEHLAQNSDMKIRQNAAIALNTSNTTNQTKYGTFAD
eukprot:gnl/MRDRNA2_/MRDRNA2_71884_c0_seq1.p1 gnl/MRDRNA2_/MRDRNA2_71884_c0~~gnl/MRDRNA2_/MRDRNA2_71884_c0_seq1.p1  ORF type:complete len:878 (+),score=184.73 gnl/MRDRNA2_/MRDRNA2_71884_c0_seq1:161-2635(+)